MEPIARGGGRSAVAAITYRTATKILNERDGLTHDFTHKQGVEHSEIVLPKGIEAGWVPDRAALWNAAERAERRSDARVAREFELALPHELSPEQRLTLTRDVAQDLANRYGAAVDFAIHRPHVQGDVRNAHAHMLMTTRTVSAQGLGEKTLIEREKKWLLNNKHAYLNLAFRVLVRIKRSLACSGIRTHRLVLPLRVFAEGGQQHLLQIFREGGNCNIALRSIANLRLAILTAIFPRSNSAKNRMGHD